MQEALDVIYKEVDKLYYEVKFVYEKWLGLIAERELERKDIGLASKEKITTN